MRTRSYILAAASLALSACGAAATATVTARQARHIVRWQPYVHAQRPLDLVGPRRDGSLILAAQGRLFAVSRSGTLSPYAPAYRSPGGEEPYIALSSGGCFGRDTVYAIRLTGGRGITAIDATGGVRRFAHLHPRGLIDGIAFDTTGRFHHDLLATVNAGSRTTVVALACSGAATIITATAPRMEGGVAVAPDTFGRFAGDLIAPSETTGNLYAVTPQGRSYLLARSGLPHGNDVGVESEAFVPRRMTAAVVADRLTPGNPHPGDDEILRLSADALRASGTKPGDLLVTTEGGAFTDAVRCSEAGCGVRYVARGPAQAHIEGHVAFK